MNKLLKKVTMISLSLAIVFNVVGCSSKSSETNSNTVTSSDGKKLDVIKIATQTGFNEFDIADELGFFKEEGIQLEYTGVLKGSTAIQAVLTGSNDVFDGHPIDVALAQLAGAKIKVVATGMIDNEKFVHMNYMVNSKSSIKSPEDLKNRKFKIAVANRNSCAEIIALEYFKKYNIPKSNAEFVIMPSNQQEQALSQSLVDIAALHPPYIKKAQIDGGVRSLFTSYEVTQGPAGGASTRGFSDEFIKEHPDTVKRFVKVLVKTHKWINTHQQQANEITAKRFNMKISQVEPFWYDENDYVNPEYIQKWVDMSEETGILEKGAIKASDIYTNKFSPNPKYAGK